MSPDALTRALRREAAARGFDACAVAHAARLDRDADALRNWLAQGRQAEMSWMERDPELRADPRRLHPGCRSVVVLATSYRQPGQGAGPATPPGRVARYARGRDYHKELGRRGAALARWLDERAGSRSRAFVDTGPVLERAWAERAGLGWIGKNANLLTRELGSWVLLSEVLTTAELEPDPGPHAEHCGTCTACIDACPTGAIVGEGIVDANRCIAYWTIEHRGAVPRERRGGSGAWIFGCDVCQEVCPWNRETAAPRGPDPLAWRENLRGIDPAEIAGQSEAEFRARFSGTSLMRAKWEGMRRNACVVLGNRRDAKDLPVLSKLLDDRDPVVAGHAAWAVAEIGGTRAHRILQRAAERETRPEVLEEIRSGLRRVPGAGDRTD